MPVRVISLLGGVELLLGLLMVKLNNVLPFELIVSGRNNLLIVGGLATDRVADGELLFPALELTEPKLLT